MADGVAVERWAVTVAEAGYRAAVADPGTGAAVTVAGVGAVTVAGGERVTAVEVGVPGPPGRDGSNGDFPAENRAAVAVLAGQPVTPHSSGVGVVPADDSSPGLRAVGLASAAAAPGFAALVRTGGVLDLPDWSAVAGTPTLAARAMYFVGPGGTIAPSPPAAGGRYVQPVGTAVGPTALLIEVETPILL